MIKLSVLSFSIVLFASLLMSSQGAITWSSYYSQFANTCGKNYNASENSTREGYYNTAAAQVDTLNSQSNTYVADVNCFSDWSTDQLRKLTQTVKTISLPTSDSFSAFSSLPESNVDWRTQNAVTDVRYQELCGNAWAFSIVAMCESSMILKQNQKLDLAEQFSTQCTASSSCDGGYLQYALQDIIYQAGIPLQSEYAYDPAQSYSAICSGGNTKKYIGESLYHFYNLTDTQLIQLLSRGPIAVSVSSEGWQYYKSGTFTCSSSAVVDHAALLVAVTNDTWILKNSWGTNWGESGYIKISRNSNSNCGIGYSAHMIFEGSLIILWMSFLGLIIILN